LVLGDIRKTIMLIFVIVVFYTIMYFVLQRSEIINSVTRLLRVGS
jgi:preprotein translocase subunit YajC